MTEFERIKFAIAQIQFGNLHLNADKTAIEANASNHKIATWIDQAITDACKRQRKICAEIYVKDAEHRYGFHYENFKENILNASPTEGEVSERTTTT